MSSSKTCLACGKSDGKLTNYKNQGYYCSKHSSQLYQYGKILEKTIKETNDYVFNEDGTTTIVLRNRKREIVGHCIIDNEDFNEIKKYTWNLNDVGYASSFTHKPNKKKLFIHRLIMKEIDELKEDSVVDHIDGNKLNNRRRNLRWATKSQNAMNSKTRKNNTSGTKGVSFDKSMNSWQAHIKINYKKIHLGYFSEIEDAVIARKKGELLYQKEFRKKED